MKKIYVLLVVCLSLTLSVTAQTYYWIGPSSGVGGNWNSNTNWSLTSGGAPVGAGIFPNSASHNVVFSQDALVNVNLENIDLLSLTVNTGITAKMFVTTGVSTPTINLLSTSSVNPALRINSNSRLEDSCDANIPFVVSFGSDAKGLIDGTWYFAGRSTVTGANGATFTLPALPGQTTRVDVNGTIQFRNNTLTPTPSPNAEGYLVFNGGSTFWLDRNAGSSPRAAWNTNSTIRITGVTINPPTINVGSVPEVGNIVFDCAGVTPGLTGWSLSNNLVVKGNLQILNTNGRTLILASNGSGIVNNFAYTVNGNFDVSGNSRVAIGNATNANKVVDFQVNGNLNMSGVSLDLQVSNLVVANPTTLRVRGSINHTAGTFGSSATPVNNTTDLYIVELNGTSNQNIASTGIINNAADEVTLRLNNAAGVTLTTPLTVGKLSFNSANKGRLSTTSTNVLTINNTGVHSLVVNAPASNGFVNGPVRRRTNSSANDYVLPTGKGSTYDPPQIRPSTSAVSFYQAEYFAAAFSDLSVAPPLNGVSNQEYWQINTISGADATVVLTLTGAVPGALASDGVVVSHYNSIDWTDYSPGGAVIQPGNSTTGTARSTVVTQNGFYTFGYGVAGALPIRLLSFDARKLSANSAQVNWVISSGSNADKFEVLKSSDGTNFITAGSVIAVDRLFTYGYIDNSLATGTTYYRLKMTDKDGKVSYSQIAAVLNGAKGVLMTSLIPTVVNSSATLSISSSERGTMQLVITDMHGRIIKQQMAAINSGNQQVLLNLQELASGAYQITGYMNKNMVGTIRFVRQ